MLPMPLHATHKFVCPNSSASIRSRAIRVPLCVPCVLCGYYSIVASVSSLFNPVSCKFAQFGGPVLTHLTYLTHLTRDQARDPGRRQSLAEFASIFTKNRHTRGQGQK